MYEPQSRSHVGAISGRGSKAGRSVRGILLLPLLLATSLGIAPAAEAREPAVTLGEINLTGFDRAEVGRVLRSAIREELGSTEFASVKARDRYVLSARLVKLSSESETRSVKTTAVVSFVLRQRKSDSLHAMAKGKATVKDAPTRVRDAETAALRAAVHSGMSRVSEALVQKKR
jgi:hypothetical protein